MILEVLKDYFEEIYIVDTEYQQDIRDKGERPTVLCAVYKGVKSQKIYKHAGKDLDKLPPHKPNKTLFVAFNVVAEAHCFQVLKIKMPKYWWDVFIENKKLYQGRIATGKGAFGLIRTAKRYGIDCMSEDLKSWNINKILNDPSHLKEDMLEYCLDDNFPLAKEKIIKDINSRLNVYDNGVFSQKKFKDLIIREGLIDRWPLTPSGQLSTTEKHIYKFSLENEAINELYFCKEFVDSQKLKGFIVGPDNRARCSLNMFGIITGRTNQSTARYPFNTAKPMRNIMKPNAGWAFLYSDYKSQEIAIAAYLSKDPMFMTAYESGDIYCYAAALANRVPKDATKKSHPKERNLFKVALIATLYGQGAKSLSAALNCTLDEAVSLIVAIKNNFPTYFEWINGIVNRAFARGYISTKFGWRYWMSKSDKINKNTLFNFPIQSHGSEMLRHSLIGLVDKGIEVNALIHDGLMVHCPLKDLFKVEQQVKRTMEDASRIVLDGNVCPVEIEIIKGNFKQEEKEQIKFDRIMNVIRDRVPVQSTPHVVPSIIRLI